MKDVGVAATRLIAPTGTECSGRAI